MKKLILFLSLVIITQACKKDKKDAQPPIQDITVKVDGVESSCNACGHPWGSGPLEGVTFNLPSADEYILFAFQTPPAVGVYTITKSNTQNPYFSIKRNGKAYRSVVGTIEVVEVTTRELGLIEKLYAYFNFKTDTIGGKSFVVTDGVIDFTE